jgi:transposase
MDELGEIRAAISMLASNARRRRFPKELRDRILSYAQSRRRQGKNIEEVAAELGMKWRTLQRWLSEQKPRRFRRVEVVADHTTSVTVHAPGGVRVEGLNIADIAELIRRLA